MLNDDADLDINNYDLPDILRLFKLPVDFTSTELKNARARVLALHPDKSNLDAQYFVFFSKAYKMLQTVHEFKTKGSTDRTNREDFDLSAEQHAALASFAAKGGNTQQLINETFEQHDLKTDYARGGYEDWLKSGEDAPIQQKSLSEMGQEFEQRRREQRALVHYTGPVEYGSNQFDGCMIDGSGTNDYSGNGHMDLRAAYDNCINTVDTENIGQTFGSVDALAKFRASQQLTPMAEDEAWAVLQQAEDADNAVSMRRAFRLAQQAEAAAAVQDTSVWSKLLRLTSS
jgi:hypothetical protein